ncbi:MAG: major facilitator superfamily 1 transporter [Oscillospiraceae bacterium]|nr:major facilitator superfamily 1 transporter [Oscillospiraceae bacterium]
MAKVDLSLRAIMVRISVLFIFLLNTEQSLVNSALADIAKAFPEADPTTISLISNISVLFSITVAFLVLPQLVKHFNKKSIILIALCIYVIGGVGAAFFNASVNQILVCRAVLGIGMGLTAPLCGAIINELYSGVEKNTMIGWANSVDSGIGIFLTMLAGLLCTISWKYTFLAYAIFLGILAMEYCFLPSMPVPMVKDASGVEHRTKVVYTSKQWTKLIFVLIFSMIWIMCSMTLLIKVSIFVSDQKLGDALVSAAAMSFFTGGILTSAFIFGFIEKVFKRYTLFLAPVIIAAGTLLVFHSASQTMLMASMYVVGFGNGLSQPLFTTKVLAIGPQFNGTFANSMLVGVMGVGQFISTYVEKVIALFVEPTAKNIIGTVSGMFAAIAVVTLVYILWNPFRGVDHVPEHQSVLRN